MKPALSRHQCRRIDRLATDELGIPGIVLMENAARSVAQEILKLPSDKTRRVAVLCGGGNNGGDGCALARHLHNAGCAVTVYAASDPAQLSGDAALNRKIVERMNLPRRDMLNAQQLDAAAAEWRGAGLVVDALLGTGFSGPLRPHLAAVIARCNELAASGKTVVAVDIPSGLDCDTGLPAEPAIRATLTVTFVALKAGFLKPEAQPCLGRVVVGDIGIPPELLDKV